MTADRTAASTPSPSSSNSNLNLNSPLLPSASTRADYNASPPVYTIDDAIEAIGLGPFQYLVLLLTGLCWTAESMEMLLLSFIKSPLQCQWPVSDSQAAFITTAVGIGMLIGSIAWGSFADRFGRRLAFITSTCFTAILGIISALSVNYIMLVIARGLVGFGIGGVPVALSILIEFVPVVNRGTWGMGLSIFWGLGAIFEATIAMLLLPTMGWRWLVITSSLPLFFVLLTSFWLSESPRWLLARGRFDEANAVLHRVAAINGRSLPHGVLSPVSHATSSTDDSALENVDVTPSHPIPSSQSNSGDIETACISHSSSRLSGISSLLRPGARMLASYIAIIWFVSAFIYYGVVMLQPEFISAENAGHRCTYAHDECTKFTSQLVCKNVQICTWTNKHVCIPMGTATMIEASRQLLQVDGDIKTIPLSTSLTTTSTNAACARQLTQSDFLATLWASIGELPGVVVAFFVVNVVGRRPLMGYYCIICASCFLALVWCTGREMETIIFFISRGTTSGVFQAIYLYTNEVYPAAVRARAMGMSSGVARFGMVVTPFIAQYLANVNQYVAQLTYFSASILAWMMILKLPIETTQRRLVDSMEELVNELQSSSSSNERNQPTFAKDPSVPMLVRVFRWNARIDGEAQR